MIEIPESITIAKQLNDTVKGRKISEVETEHTRHSFAWYHGDPAAYAGQMTGRMLGTAAGIGSMVEMEHQTKLSKKTVGGPCPYCGNLIQKMNYLGGTVYYCPYCQE